MADPALESKPETPLLNKIVPVRGAAQKAAAKLKQQNTRRPRTSPVHAERTNNKKSDPAEDQHDKMETDKSSGRGLNRLGVPRGQGRGHGRKRKRGRGGVNDGDREPTTVQRQPRMTSSKICSTLSFGSSSPLSSPESLRTPLKRTLPSASSTPSKRTKVITLIRKAKPAVGLPPTPQPSGSEDKYGNFYTEDDLVWVHLNSSGDAIDSRKGAERASYWWPAQVIDDKGLRADLKLYGDDGHGPERLVNVSWSSPSTILTFRHEGHIRFSSANFTLVKTSQDGSPFETQASTQTEPSDLISRWKEALDLALADDADNDLPDPHMLVVMSASEEKKGKKREEGILEPTPTPSPSRLQKRPPAPLDEEIKVGKEDGELVLARDHKDRPDHWPARVIGVSQNNRTGNWLYEVCFIDGKKKKMERKWFFSPEEEGFATCQMGVWHTDLPASDTERADSDDEFLHRDATRSSSPHPSESGLEEIADPKIFCELPLREQMRYVYPFLCRIIRREYPPSFERHDAFMKGGKAKEHLGQSASLRGEFSENKMKKVSALVRKVMLRDERWAERVYDGENVRNDEEIPVVQASDQTTAEPAIESVITRSPDLDAAMTLTELKSSEGSTLHPSPTLGTQSIKAQTPPLVSVADSCTTSDDIAGSAQPPPSSIVSTCMIDQYSDMEMDSEEEEDLTANEAVGSDSARKVLKETTDITPNSIIPAYISPEVRPRGPEMPPESPDIDDLPSDEHVKAASMSRMRPTGCADYEDLPRSERGLYCADVLLPEAVLQLHLLRAGRRSSAHLLTPEEEIKLYEEGLGLLRTEVHWVTQIVMLRQFAEKTFKKSMKKQDMAPKNIIIEGGTLSRPKVSKKFD